MRRYFEIALDGVIRTWHAVSYFVWLFGQIVLSAVHVAKVIIDKKRAHAGIVAVHLDASSRSEIILLSTSIELTPGTFAVELGTDQSGSRALFVHVLELDDHDKAEMIIKHEFEERIFRFTRPTARRLRHAPPRPRSGGMRFLGGGR